MIGHDVAGPPHVDRWPRIVVLALVNIAAGLAAGLIVLALSRPSQDELQRAALDEAGLPVQLESAPVIGPALDTYTQRIEARIVAESRLSAIAALATGTVVAVGCAVLNQAVTVRRRPPRRRRGTRTAPGRRESSNPGP